MPSSIARLSRAISARPIQGRPALFRSIILCSSALAGMGAAKPAAAATYLANDTASMILAIQNANANPGADTIQMTADITMDSSLAAITSQVTLDGGGFTLTADNETVALVSFSPSGPITVTNLSIASLSNGLLTSGAATVAMLGDASISASSVAVSMSGSGNVLTNAGTIESGMTQAIVMNGGTLINQAGGTISGGPGAQAIYNSDALALNVTNAGTLNGTVHSASTGALTLDNQAGAQINASGTAVLSSSGALTVTNDGDIAGGISGIRGTSSADSITNSGQIVAGTIAGGVATLGGNWGIILINGGTIANEAGGLIGSANEAIRIQSGTGTIGNAGTITGTQFGIAFIGGGSVTNEAGGLIEGQTGISANGLIDVTNAGSIDAGATGIMLFGGGSVTNAAGGVIDGLYGVSISGGAGTVSNAGTIEGSQIGILFNNGGTVTNEATGLITGNNAVSAGGASTIVNNAGTIAGTASGISLLAGGSIDNDAGATISGNVAARISGGAGTIVNDGSINGTLYGLHLFGGGSVTNGSGAAISGSQSIRMEGASALSVTNAGTLTGSVFVAGTGTLTLDNEVGGLISSVNSAIDSGGTGALVITNDGDIAGTSWGIVGRNSTDSVTNSGRIVSGTIVGDVVTPSGSEAVILASGGTVTNEEGGLIAGGAWGVRLGGAGTVDNAGTITGARAVQISGGAGTVSNAGTIAGTNYGAILLGGGSVTNQEGGSISGTRAVEISGGTGTVTNSGTIAGTDFGAILFGGGTMTNEADGLISGGVRAVHVQGGAGTVTNAGTIAGTNYGAILLGGGSVTNEEGGSISGTRAVEITGGTGTVTNSGTIAGTDFGAILFGGGTMTNEADGLISGGFRGVSVQGGAGTVTNAGVITATVDNAVTLFSGGSVTNTGTLNATGSDGWGIYSVGGAATIVNEGTVNGGSGGIVVSQTGVTQSVTNSGTVNSAGVGVWGNGGTLAFTNTGTVAAGTIGVSFSTAGGTLDNDGAISGTTGVESAGAATTITNGGTITGTANTGINLLAGGSITNEADGTIAGATMAIGVQGGTATVVNEGTITSAAGAGVYTQGNAAVSVTNSETGAITTGSHALRFGGTSATVVNEGLLSASAADAIWSSATLDLDNSGTISSALYAAVTTQLATIQNSGTISGGTDTTWGYALQIGDSATVTNLADGILTGGAAGSIRLTNAGTIGLDLQLGSTATGQIVSDGSGTNNVTIAGTLDGAYNASAGTAVDNLILSATGSMAGANLGAGDDSFLYRGGVFSGLVDGGAGTDSFTGNLGTGSASISLTNITGFETHMHEAGTLTLTGSSSGGAGWTVADGAALTLAGSLTDTGTTAITATGSTTITLADGAVLSSAAGDGIASSGGLLTLVNGGSIDSATGHGLVSTGTAAVSNSGDIDGAGYGVQLGATSTLTNLAGGTIGGTTGSLELLGTGTITIDLQAGSTTTGQISSAGSGTNTLAIAGMLNGAYDASAGTAVDHLALALTGSMAGADLGAGNDSFLYQGGSFSGTLLGGSGTDSFISHLGAGSSSLDLGDLAAFESYAQQAGTLTLTGSASGGPGWTLSGGAGLVLAGALTDTTTDAIVATGNTNVILLGGASLSSAAGSGISSSGGLLTLTNNGSISAPAGYAVSSSGGATIANNMSGAISGLQGIHNTGGALTLTNAAGATIGGDTVAVYSDDEGTWIINSGAIEGFLGDAVGIALDGGGTIRNLSGGLISGDGAAILLLAGGDYVVDLDAGSTVDGDIDTSLSTGTNAFTVAGTLDGNYFGGSGVDTVTLLSGFIVGGGLDGGGGSDIFALGGSADGTFGGSSAGFEARAMNGAGTWTLTGVDGSDAAWAINSGVLAASGGAAIGDGAAVTVGAGGALQLLGGETIGSLAGDGSVLLGGHVLVLAGTEATEFGGVIEGTGGLTIAGGGTLTLSGDNLYTGTTLVHDGTLRLGASEVLDDESILIVAAGGTLDLQGFDETVAELEVLGTITGTGTLGAASYEFLGGTINMDLGSGDLVNFGGTTLLNGTSGASLVVVLDGTLQMGADERLLDSALVEIAEGAVLDLGGYEETVGGLAGSGIVELGDGLLAVGGGDLSSTFLGEINGSGGIEKVGEGLFVLAGENNFTGGTVVTDGELRLLGSMFGGVAVEGGIFSGAGAMAGELNLAGGTLSPGVDGIGTFQASSFASTGGILAFDIGSAGSDALQISAAVTLSGGSLETNLLDGAGDGSFSQFHTLIHAGAGITGTFANPAAFVAADASGTLFERLNYGSNAVVLELRQLIDFTATSGTLNANQLAVADALNRTEMEAGNAFAAMLDALSELPAGGRGAALASLGGEGAANSATAVALLSDGFVGQLGRRMHAAAPGRVASAASAEHLREFLPEEMDDGALALAAAGGANARTSGPGLWLNGYTFDSDLDGKDGQADLSGDGEGVVGGLDLPIGSAMIGAAAGYSGFDATTDTLATRSEGESWQFGVYASVALGDSYAGLAAGYVDANVDTSRAVAVGPVTGTLEGSTDVRVLSAELSAGHDFHLSADTSFGLAASLRGADIRQNAYDETGGEVLALAHDRIDRQYGVASAHARIAKSFAFSGGSRLKADAGAGLSVAEGDLSAALRSTFIGAPEASGAFATTGASLPSAWASLGAGLSLAGAGDRWEFGLRYEGRHASRLSENQLSAGFSLRW